MRVALYLRQSLDNAEGIERQRERCQALALARGWEVVATFEDNAVSASKSRDSAAWSQMLDGVQKGAFQAVVATKVDRLARRVKDILDLTDAGVGIATVEGELDTTTDMGKFQAVLLAALAELEANRKGQRHKDAHVSRAAQGIPRTTKRPYGWKPDGMTLELREAAHLRIALRGILAGRSIRGEAERMNRAGQTTPVYSNSGGRKWDSKALTSVLDRPRIAGINEYLGVETAVSRITPIVPREEWEAYRALRKSADRLTNMGSSDLRHYLTDVAECPCGATMRARPVRSRGKIVTYYQCRNQGTKDGKSHTAMNAARLELLVEMNLYGFMSGGWWKASGTGSRVKAIRAELSELAERTDDLTEARLVKGVNKARVDAELAAVEVQRTGLQADLEKALSADFGAEWLDALMTAGEDSYESADAFKVWFDDLDPEKRRALVRGRLTVKVKPGHGTKRVEIEPR